MRIQLPDPLIQKVFVGCVNDDPGDVRYSTLLGERHFYERKCCRAGTGNRGNFTQALLAGLNIPA